MFNPFPCPRDAVRHARLTLSVGWFCISWLFTLSGWFRIVEEEDDYSRATTHILSLFIDSPPLSSTAVGAAGSATGGFASSIAHYQPTTIEGQCCPYDGADTTSHSPPWIDSRMKRSRGRGGFPNPLDLRLRSSRVYFSGAKYTGLLDYLNFQISALCHSVNIDVSSFVSWFCTTLLLSPSLSIGHFSGCMPCEARSTKCLKTAEDGGRSSDKSPELSDALVSLNSWRIPLTLVLKKGVRHRSAGQWPTQLLSDRETERENKENGVWHPDKATGPTFEESLIWPTISFVWLN